MKLDWISHILLVVIFTTFWWFVLMNQGIIVFEDHTSFEEAYDKCQEKLEFTEQLRAKECPAVTCNTSWLGLILSILGIIIGVLLSRTELWWKGWKKDER